jgi:hypothetical protein
VIRCANCSKYFDEEPQDVCFDCQEEADRSREIKQEKMRERIEALEKAEYRWKPIAEMPDDLKDIWAVFAEDGVVLGAYKVSQGCPRTWKLRYAGYEYFLIPNPQKSGDC